MQETNPKDAQGGGRSQTIYEELLRRIIVGQIQQGEFLSEVKFADEFQSSRTPIREACIHLHKEGFLRVAPHKGYVVTEVSVEEIRELYELRQLLEPRAAERAAANTLEPGFREEWEASIERVQSLAEQERTYEVFVEIGRSEYQFHCGLARAGGNRKITKFMAEIMNQFRRFHFICFRHTPWLKTSFDEHLAILDAICRRDGAAARSLMEDHITRGAERGLQLFLGEFKGGAPR